MEPILCENIICYLFHVQYIPSEHWTKNAHHLGLWSNVTQALSVPAARTSLGINTDGVWRAESWDPPQTKGIQRRNASAFQETQTTCFKAVTGRARRSVCWHTCHDSVQGALGPGGGDRSLPILKRFLKEASQWFWGNFLVRIHPLERF